MPPQGGQAFTDGIPSHHLLTPLRVKGKVKVYYCQCPRHYSLQVPFGFEGPGKGGGRFSQEHTIGNFPASEYVARRE